MPPLELRKEREGSRMEPSSQGLRRGSYQRMSRPTHFIEIFS
ncbi:hypothetical protein P3T31_003617 [Rhizobium sp. AN70]|nr:hypothetical protein [Rhizobium sp. AN70]